MRSVIRGISKDEDRYKRDKGIIEMRLIPRGGKYKDDV